MYSRIRPVLFQKIFLVNFAHGISFDRVHHAKDGRHLVRGHLLFQLATEVVQVQRSSLVEFLCQ